MGRLSSGEEREEGGRGGEGGFYEVAGVQLILVGSVGLVDCGAGGIKDTRVLD